jgi:hypothetical protein
VAHKHLSRLQRHIPAMVYLRTFYTALNSLFCKLFKAAHANYPQK